MYAGGTNELRMYVDEVQVESEASLNWGSIAYGNELLNGGVQHGPASL